MCGILHQKKLTIDGLDIQHNTESYTYYPAIETSEQRAIADRIFTYIPMDAQTSNCLNIYILKGGELAPVFDYQGQYLGIWNLKVRMAYIADTEKEQQVIGKYMALKHRIENTAKSINSEVDCS